MSSIELFCLDIICKLLVLFGEISKYIYKFERVYNEFFLL